MRRTEKRRTSVEDDRWVGDDPSVLHAPVAKTELKCRQCGGKMVPVDEKSVNTIACANCGSRQVQTKPSVSEGGDEAA